MSRVKENLLKNWLKKNGMTREKLARQLDMSTVFVLNLVNGKNTDIRMSSLEQLHLITGISYDELVGFCMYHQRKNLEQKSA